MKVRKPDEAEAARLREGQVLIGFLDPLADREGVERLASRGVIAFAMESIPRTTRAQSMDALSSQATVGGYKGALLAAEHLPRFFPMLMTAAGTVPPAKVLVIGAGVAGLQAIATARRLGAVVTGFDVRPVVREQIESLGANWLDLGVTGAEAEGGYARELTPEEMQAQQEALEARIADFDVVITTAAVPGRAAPRIIPASAVRAMRTGLGDRRPRRRHRRQLRADEAGRGRRARRRDARRPDESRRRRCRTTRRRSIRGTSQALLLHLAPEGELALDWSDEITAGACRGRQEGGSERREPQHDPVFEVTILVLAIFLGVEVISKVPTLLHTPLMSGTNAIHGIVIVGAMLVLGLAAQGPVHVGHRLRRGRARVCERRRRLRRHRPHARDVQEARQARAVSGLTTSRTCCT